MAQKTYRNEITFGLGALVRHLERAGTVRGYERDGDGIVVYLVVMEGQEDPCPFYPWELESEGDYAKSRKWPDDPDLAALRTEYARLVAAVGAVLANHRHGAAYGSWTGIADEAMHELERAYAKL